MPAKTAPPALPLNFARAAWLDPPGPAATLPNGAWRARYRGPVRGAWGGRCSAHGCVTAATLAFHADLRLGAGDAVNASLRGGGHGFDWVCVDDPDHATGSPVPVDLQLWLGGVLLGPPQAQRGGATDPGGSAFVGSEDGERRPLALKLRLDPRQPGPLGAEARHRVALPNRCWSPLRSRFASHIVASHDQALHWMVGARLSLAPAGGERVRLLLPGRAGEPAFSPARPPGRARRAPEAAAATLPAS